MMRQRKVLSAQHASALSHIPTTHSSCKSWQHAHHCLTGLQLKGTMNWSCPAWLDWFHGGLQFQIEHHLFPALPRHNLRRASLLAQPLCHDLGLSYHCPSFFGVSPADCFYLHCPRSAFLNHALLCLYACSMCMLHVHAPCACSMCMQHVHAQAHLSCAVCCAL